jgi:RNA polymerase sigma-70 factor (ECF subfamily)
MSPFDHSTQLQGLLDRLGAGDAAARDELIGRAFDRLRHLARRMFRRRHPDLRVAVETDDVLQAAAVRLHRALSETRPETVRNFFRLANTQVRRELIDLARRHLGPGGVKAARAARLGAGSRSHHHALDEQPAVECEPADLEGWADFHEAVAGLPDEEREVVGLLWYQGLPQAEAAAVLGVVERTIKRRWRSARVLLFEALGGECPEA